MNVVNVPNPYLAEYKRMFEHQRTHYASWYGHPLPGGEDHQPWEVCMECARNGESIGRYQDMRRGWSWAIPNEEALDTIIKYSPIGLIEIGAGAGYWAYLLREYGLDVLAFDPTPPPSPWSNRSGSFTEVLTGDHTVVIGSSERTLFLCWPSYSESWTHEVIELYGGDTIIYVGEGNGGCTGDDRMHALLGMDGCYHWEEGETCDACGIKSLFEEVASVDIPQWFGLHDRLYVCRRTDGRLV